MTSEKLYIGIDLNNERAMISLFRQGMQDVEAVSAAPGQERYQIPAAVFVTNMGKYYYGDEALRRQDRTDGHFFSNIYEGAMEPENLVYRNILVQFLRRLLRFGEKYDPECANTCLALTVPEMTDSVVELVEFLRVELKFDLEHFRLMDYGESFFAHTYHQDSSVWIHDVALFDFQGDRLTHILLHTDGTGSVKRVTSSKKEWTVPEYLLNHPEGKDEFFANILRESFLKKVVSGVYFIGDGFDGDWYQESLRVIGPHKRVFKGKNLYTRGACVAAYRNDVTDNWHFYYDCSYKLRGEISIKVRKGQEVCLLRLTQLGENWFAPTRKHYFMYDGNPNLEVWVRTRNRISAQNEVFHLDFLPERNPHSIRLSIQAVPVSGNQVVLIVEDDGFGELFESSGKVWEFPVVFTE